MHAHWFFAPFHHIVFFCGSRYRVHTPGRVMNALPAAGPLSRETCCKGPARLRRADGPAFTDASPQTAGLTDTPRVSAPAIAAQCSTSFPTMPWDGTTGTSGTAALEILSREPGAVIPVLCGGVRVPGARDGASVQSFYGTVIILRMIYLYIYTL